MTEWIINCSDGVLPPRLHVGLDEVLLAMPFISEPLEIDYERRNKSPMEIAVTCYLHLRRILMLNEALAVDANANFFTSIFALGVPRLLF